MKTLSNFIGSFTKVGIAFLFAGLLVLSQCKKDDLITPLDPVTTSGQDVINSTNGTWDMDKAHSSINWKTAYYGDGAWLTGKFTTFDINIDFDEANPTATTIEAWVQLSACNTGEPGRDALGKCLNGYLGVLHNGDTLSDGSLDPAGIIGTSDTARFTSTSIEVFGDGYVATGDFQFHGFTKSLKLYFSYIGQKDYSTDQDGSKIKGGFIGHFEFLGISDFGITSTSVDDKILLEVGANFKKL